MIVKKVYLLILLLLCFSCKTKQTIPIDKDDGKIEIVVLQINDVYEIAPLPGDDLGGLARVATLKKRLTKKNKNTILVIAGDFLSPSVIGTLEDRAGNDIRGKHMIETLNHSGLDIAIFGNHEFDIKEEDLQLRLNESEFDWVCSNIFYAKDSKLGPFYKMRSGVEQYIPKIITRTFSDSDGTHLKLGIFAVTLADKVACHVIYEDPIETAKQMTTDLENQNVDMILPITHLDLVDDKKLARVIPKFPLIIGGHDHNHMSVQVGKTTITKADANAKTAYVHTISYDKKTRNIKVASKLVKIDKSIASDPEVAKIVKKWKDIAYEDLKKKGFEPNAKVIDLKESLDGTEKTIRGGQAKLGEIITGAIFKAGRKNPDLALTNSGSIRVDDKLDGTLTQYDIIRILPYSGEIWEIEIKGELLKRILKVGEESINKGAYIQRKNVEYDKTSKTFKVNGKLIDSGKIYTVALNDFMLSGYDYKWLTKKTEGIIKIHKPEMIDGKKTDDVRHDIRKAVIQFLKNK